jgi:hypothetical protein
MYKGITIPTRDFLASRVNQRQNCTSCYVRSAKPVIVPGTSRRELAGEQQAASTYPEPNPMLCKAILAPPLILLCRMPSRLFFARSMSCWQSNIPEAVGNYHFRFRFPGGHVRIQQAAPRVSASTRVCFPISISTLRTEVVSTACLLKIRSTLIVAT